MLFIVTRLDFSTAAEMFKLNLEVSRTSSLGIAFNATDCNGTLKTAGGCNGSSPPVNPGSLGDQRFGVTAAAVYPVNGSGFIMFFDALRTTLDKNSCPEGPVPASLPLRNCGEFAPAGFNTT